MGQRYEAVLGFNTKQWWAYDNNTGEVIDPPIEVLDILKTYPLDEQEYKFNKILFEVPEWLFDEGYRYSEDTDI